jgi:hypothetical protein
MLGKEGRPVKAPVQPVQEGCLSRAAKRRRILATLGEMTERQ